MPSRRDASQAIVANQVFIGCPWKNVKRKYEKIIKKLNQKFPIFFKIIGREPSQNSTALLELIKTQLKKSSMAIFDVTGGNPNVSLEFGYAEGSDITRFLFMNVRGGQNRTAEDSAIISDLAGQIRNHYKTEASLLKQLKPFCTRHPYTLRYENAFKKAFKNEKKGKKRMYRTLGPKVIHFLDDKESCRREDLIQSLMGEGYRRAEIENVLKKFHAHSLIKIGRGQFSEVIIA